MKLINALLTAALVAAPAASHADPRMVVVDDDSRPRPVRQARADSSAERVYYAGCNEVRALGKAPLYLGQPGYRVGMDGDRDGIACEPIRDRGRRR